MKSILLTFAVIALNFQAYSQDHEGIQFETGTWEEILAIAKKAKKPIFVDAYTTWCGPCKWMSKNTFTDKDLGNYMTENFISYKMDMEKGEGIEFAKENNVRVYPSLLFFDSNGKLIHRAAGAQKADAFKSTCQVALDPKERFGTFQNKYDRGDSDKAFLLKYINKCNAAGLSSDEPFNKYWTLLDDSEKQTEESLKLMNSITKGFADMDHELFVYFKNNKAQYEKAISKEAVAPFWNQAYNSAVWYAAATEKKKEQQEKLKKIKSTFSDRKDEIDAFFEMNQAWQSKDEEAIADASAVYVEVTTDWGFLNTEAWNLYEATDSKEQLEKALGWAEKSVGFNANYLNLDTKGAILFKLGRLNEAQEALEDAVAKADEETRPQDLNATETLLREVIMAQQEDEE